MYPKTNKGHLGYTYRNAHAVDYAIRRLETSSIRVINVEAARKQFGYPEITLSGLITDKYHYPSSDGRLKRISFDFYSHNEIYVEEYLGRRCSLKDMPHDQAKIIVDVIDDVVDNHPNDPWVYHYTKDDVQKFLKKCKRTGANPATYDPNAYCRYADDQDEDAAQYRENYLFECYEATGGILNKDDFYSNRSGKTRHPDYIMNGVHAYIPKKLDALLWGKRLVNNKGSTRRKSKGPPVIRYVFLGMLLMLLIEIIL